MIYIGEDQETLYMTRGDVPGEFNRVAFYFPIYNVGTGEEERYQFKPDDKISFVVKDKKGYTKQEILRVEKTLKEMGYMFPTEMPELILSEEDTKAFRLLNKRRTYWYDIVLNDTTTILGYDDEGAKRLIAFPEAREVDEIEEGE